MVVLLLLLLLLLYHYYTTSASFTRLVLVLDVLDAPSGLLLNLHIMASQEFAGELVNSKPAFERCSLVFGVLIASYDEPRCTRAQCNPAAGCVTFPQMPFGRGGLWVRTSIII